MDLPWICSSPFQNCRDVCSARGVFWAVRYPNSNIDYPHRMANKFDRMFDMADRIRRWSIGDDWGWRDKHVCRRSRRSWLASKCMPGECIESQHRYYYQCRLLDFVGEGRIDG